MKKYTIQDLIDVKVCVRLTTQQELDIIKAKISGGSSLKFENPDYSGKGYYYRFGRHPACSGNDGHDYPNGQFYISHNIPLCEFKDLDIPENNSPYITNNTILKIYKLLDIINDPSDTGYMVARAIAKDLEKSNRKLTESEMKTLNALFKINNHGRQTV